jgi:4-hydroxyproline epimerase
LIQPITPGRLVADVPAGSIDIAYSTDGPKVTAVRITNVPSYVAAKAVAIDVEGLGPLSVDVAYGGNFYAIVEPQGGYTGLDAIGARRLVEFSAKVREAVREKCEPVHPLDPTIRGVSHILWADRPKSEGADGRNAVFYGEGAIDRSPCGTGTSARLAHLAASGRLKVGDGFVHESYIGSRFVGRIERAASVGEFDAIIPSIEGSAVATGFNTIWIDRDDPFWEGFQVR